MENILLPWSVERAKGSNKPGLSWRNREAGMAWPKRETGIRVDTLSQSLFQSFIIGHFCNSYSILSNKEIDAWSPSTLANFLWVNSLEHHPSWWTSFSHKINLSALAVLTSCPNTSTETQWPIKKRFLSSLCHMICDLIWTPKSAFVSGKTECFYHKEKNERMGRHYHYNFLNRLFYYYCFQNWCLVFNVFLSLLLGIWFATISP